MSSRSPSSPSSDNNATALPFDMDLSHTVTLGNRLAFRTSTALDPKAHTKFFHVAQFNPDTIRYEVRRVDTPLSLNEVMLLETLDIEGFEPQKQERQIEVLKHFPNHNTGLRNDAFIGFRVFLEALLELDDLARYPRNKNTIALPDDLRMAEKDLLGCFHVRRYAIEEGLVPSHPDPVTHKSSLFDLPSLQQDAFDLRILTEIDEKEWRYAAMRVNKIRTAAPIFVNVPYDDIPLDQQEKWIDKTPIQAMTIDTHAMIQGHLKAQADKENAAKQDRAVIDQDHDHNDILSAPKRSLSRREQEWIFAALLTEYKSVADTAEKWLELLKTEHDHVLKPSDLVDRHGPLGALFLKAQSGATIRHAFEAVPPLLAHFNRHGYSIPLRHFHETTMGSHSLHDQMEAAHKQGIKAPYEALYSPLTRGIRP